MPQVIAGQRFGPYEVVEEIAAGGMGAVYKATDATLDRTVALKVANLPDQANPRVLRAFVEEAQAAAKLEHPNIVPIYSAGEENGTAYFAMQYVSGNTLDVLLKDGIPCIEDTFTWMYEVADALRFAHHHGIIHCDVKPGNIMIDSFGRALLLDFGLARAFDQRSSRDSDKVAVTLGYASPEQLHGRHTDQRSDIYSLGCVLYELLTSQLPFGGDDVAEAVRAKLHQEALPVEDLNPEVPKEIAALVNGMIRRQRTERPENMDQIVSVLAVYRRGEDGQVNAALSQITDRIKKVPPFPHVGLQLMKELKRESTNVESLSKIINADSVMAARILRVVNSAYYGVPNRVTTIKLAVSLLGLRQIQDLAYGIYLRELGSSFSGGTTDLLQRYWTHSVAVAFLAEGISRKLSLATVSPAEAYMAGLLHDMGLLLLSRYEIKKTVLAVRLQAEKKISLEEAEREVIGVTHCELAAWLDRKWSLPDSLREVAIHHHTARPESYLAELETVVRLADAIALRVGYGFYTTDYGWTLEAPLVRMLKVSRPDLPEEGLLFWLEGQLSATFTQLREYLDTFAQTSKPQSAEESSEQGRRKAPPAKPHAARPRTKKPAKREGFFRRMVAWIWG